MKKLSDLLLKLHLGWLLCNLGKHPWEKENKQWILDGGKKNFELIDVRFCQRCPCMLMFAVDADEKVVWNVEKAFKEWVKARTRARRARAEKALAQERWLRRSEK